MSKSGLVATVAFFGPNDQVATKAVVGILDKKKEMVDMRKWFSPTSDVREDEIIRQEIVDFIKGHQVDHATATESVIGCPHEEGIDYPEGQFCPMCDFWRGRNRLGKSSKP
ncbi:MAG TPA: hypothetical protein VMZ27_13390 [Candidatus Saccharimonadales bacterium]|nr:hypothetical protein [Candidatus Saccharimonadales bacterium]